MIGIDTVRIKRIEDMYERFGDKALCKFLHKEEIVLSKKNIKTIAGFFAAKEAISKALGLGISKECGFMDIRVYKNSLNAPSFTLSRHLVERFGITHTALSITHDGDYAIAAATLQTKTPPPQKLWHE